MATAGNAAALDFEKLRAIGDEPADKIVQDLIVLSGETPPDQIARQQAAILDDLLLRLFAWTPAAQKPIEPRPVETFLRDSDVLPAWCDAERDLPRVQRAQEFFARFRLTALLVLGCASLPHCYAHGEIANTLTLSGLLGMRVRQRIEETAVFVNAVMQPGSFTDRSAFPWIRKIRLIHAAMRELTQLRQDVFPDRKGTSLTDVLVQRNWDPRDGMPLDQVELAYVLLTFSHVVLQGWKTLRIRPGGEEQRDFLYSWALVGSVLGVRDELLAPLREGSVAAARSLFDQIKAVERETDFGKDPRAKEKGRLLTATLNVLLSDSVLRAPLPAPLRWVRPAADPLLRSLPRTLLRRLVGCRTANELWVDRPPLFHSIVHALIIEFVGFTDFANTSIGRKITESGLWTNVSIRLHFDVAEGLGRALPPNAPAERPAA